MLREEEALPSPKQQHFNTYRADFYFPALPSLFPSARAALASTPFPLSFVAQEKVWKKDAARPRAAVAAPAQA